MLTQDNEYILQLTLVQYIRIPQLEDYNGTIYKDITRKKYFPALGFEPTPSQPTASYLAITFLYLSD